jgi:hypothetical protein
MLFSFNRLCLLVCVCAALLLYTFVFKREVQPNAYNPVPAPLPESAAVAEKAKGGAKKKPEKTKPVVASGPCAPKFADFIAGSHIFELNKRYTASWAAIENATERWRRLPEFVNLAWKDALERMKPYTFKTDLEEKHFIEIKKDDGNCNVITFGIGRETDFEQDFFAKHPKCKFIGVDPVEEDNRVLVEQLKGRFVKTAVGAQSGKYKANMYEKKAQPYVANQTDHMGLAEFMDIYSPGPLVDLFNFDVEGAEYGLMRLMTEHPDQLPPICQVNAEFHWPPETYGSNMTDFTDLIQKVADGERYVMMSGLLMEGGYNFLKVFLVNVKDEPCTQKYLC